MDHRGVEGAKIQWSRKQTCLSEVGRRLGGPHGHGRRVRGLRERTGWNLNLATERYVHTLHDQVLSYSFVTRAQPAHLALTACVWLLGPTLRASLAQKRSSVVSSRAAFNWEFVASSFFTRARKPLLVLGMDESDPDELEEDEEPEEDAGAAPSSFVLSLLLSTVVEVLGSGVSRMAKFFVSGVSTIASVEVAGASVMAKVLSSACCLKPFLGELNHTCKAASAVGFQSPLSPT